MCALVPTDPPVEPAAAQPRQERSDQRPPRAPGPGMGPTRASLSKQASIAGWLAVMMMVLADPSPLFAQITNLPPAPSPLPDAGFSLLRLIGAFCLVLALFLGGLWLLRNWQRMMLYKGRPPKLNVLEVRSLGHRFALYLVGYGPRRFLIGASPAGINLLARLPDEGSAKAEPGSLMPELDDRWEPVVSSTT